MQWLWNVCRLKGGEIDILSKEHEKKLTELLESKLKEAEYRGVVRGYRAAYDTMIEQINLGMTLDEIKAWVIGEKKKTEIVEKVTVKGSEDK